MAQLSMSKPEGPPASGLAVSPTIQAAAPPKDDPVVQMSKRLKKLEDRLAKQESIWEQAIENLIAKGDILRRQCDVQEDKIRSLTNKQAIYLQQIRKLERERSESERSQRVWVELKSPQNPSSGGHASAPTQGRRKKHKRKRQ